MSKEKKMAHLVKIRLLAAKWYEKILVDESTGTNSSKHKLIHTSTSSTTLGFDEFTKDEFVIRRVH